MAMFGIVLFTYLIITFNNSSQTQIELNLENEAIITASSVAQSVIDEILTKSFDEETVTKAVTKTSQLSTTIGKENNESAAFQFDDVDDYDNFTDKVTLSRLGKMDYKVEVSYAKIITDAVTGSKTVTVTGSKTFSKLIKVTVKSPYLMAGEMSLSHLVSY